MLSRKTCFLVKKFLLKVFQQKQLDQLPTGGGVVLLCQRGKPAHAFGGSSAPWSAFALHTTCSSLKLVCLCGTLTKQRASSSLCAPTLHEGEDVLAMLLLSPRRPLGVSIAKLPTMGSYGALPRPKTHNCYPAPSCDPDRSTRFARVKSPIHLLPTSDGFKPMS